jgi:hypothetical protein
MRTLIVLIDGLAFAEGPRWRDGKLFFSDMPAHQVLAGTAHSVVVFIWAVVFVLCGQFGELSGAFYSSAMLYTSLGTVTWPCPRHGNCWGPSRQRMGC